MKFKSDIEVQAGLKDSSGAAGTSGQVLSSTASGVSWVSQSGFVPYTGATGDVDLGIHQLKADSLAVSTTSIEGADAGEIVWNSIDGTFDMGLIGGVTLQAGQEMYIYGKATGTILNGEAVMFAGVQGDHILIARADAATINANPEYFIGVSTQDFAANDFGYVTVFGNVRGLDTTAYTLGAVLYYNSASATDGLLTSAVPTAPNAKIEVAAVVRVHATQGILLVRPHIMPKIKDIQDVYAPSPSNDNGLWWNASTSRYENNSIAGILGYTPADDANVVKLTGNQTINGEKTFAGTIYSDNATYLKQYTSFSNQTDYTNIGGQLEGIYIGTTSASSTISMTNLTAFRAYELPDASGTIALTSDIAGYVPYTGATSNVNLGSYSITANSFIKVGGNSTQYLKADGSVSTAMNSRIEVNFIATAGQTTFVTPYEVGQIDVYYNGSKLYPNEFTATNGTDIILATGATLNAQISIVKYVSSLSTTAIRNETTFTTTAGQTTFAVNYSPGQVDVFYNGSKLNISEFTATNGTSVVLGFACAAGESIVIDSYVNQVSGASGTTNYVSKFTGAASLGDSSIYAESNKVGIYTLPKGIGTSKSLEIGNRGVIYDNNDNFAFGNNGWYDTSWKYKETGFASLISTGQGSFTFETAPSGAANAAITFTERFRINQNGSMCIATTTATEKLNLDGNMLIRSAGAIKFNRLDNAVSTNLYDAGSYFTLDNRNGNGFAFQSTGANIVNITASGLLGVGTGLSGSARVNILNVTSAPFLALRSTNNIYEIAKMSFDQNTDILSIVNNQGASSSGITFATNGSEKVRIDVNGTALFRRTISLDPSYAAGFEGAVFFKCAVNGNNSVNFFNASTTYVASIVTNASSIVYGTGSDYRLKEDLKDFNGLEKVSKIKVYDFKFIKEEDRMDGVLAHELQEVVPYAVTGKKDELDEKGNVKIQNVDYSKLTPILVKAIQEQQVQIQELKAEIEILKNK